MYRQKYKNDELTTSPEIQIHFDYIYTVIVEWIRMKLKKIFWL